MIYEKPSAAKHTRAPAPRKQKHSRVVPVKRGRPGTGAGARLAQHGRDAGQGQDLAPAGRRGLAPAGQCSRGGGGPSAAAACLQQGAAGQGRGRCEGCQGALLMVLPGRGGGDGGRVWTCVCRVKDGGGGVVCVKERGAERGRQAVRRWLGACARVSCSTTARVTCRQAGTQRPHRPHQAQLWIMLSCLTFKNGSERSGARCRAVPDTPASARLAWVAAVAGPQFAPRRRRAEATPIADIHHSPSALDVPMHTIARPAAKSNWAQVDRRRLECPPPPPEGCAGEGMCRVRQRALAARSRTGLEVPCSSAAKDEARGVCAEDERGAWWLRASGTHHTRKKNKKQWALPPKGH